MAQGREEYIIPVMAQRRFSIFALPAWILPLLLLASWGNAEAAMFCRMQGAVVRSACCCPPPAVRLAEDSKSSAGATFEAAQCCDTTVAPAPRTEDAELPVVDALGAPLHVLSFRLEAPLACKVPQSSGSTATRSRGSPLVLLKHAFLI